MAVPRKKPTEYDPSWPWQPKYARYLNRASVIVGWLLLLWALVMWFTLRN